MDYNCMHHLTMEIYSGNKTMDRKSILVVDDDADVREVIKGALERQYDLLEASRYSEAVKLIRYPIDLAIIDYLLPDRDGFEVLKTLREADPSLPAIIMTGHSDESLVIKAVRREVADYIKKPIDLAYLRSRLMEIFRSENEDNKPERLEKREGNILDGIAAHIEEKYMKDLKLENISRMACMSRFRFCRLFKKRFGQTFVSYLNSVRLKNAVRLLRDTDFRITEIFYLVGYSNNVHFNRVFKTVYKMSPRDYRRKVFSLHTQ